jgi:hypothetical protein
MRAIGTTKTSPPGGGSIRRNGPAQFAIHHLCGVVLRGTTVLRIGQYLRQFNESACKLSLAWRKQDIYRPKLGLLRDSCVVSRHLSTPVQENEATEWRIQKVTDAASEQVRFGADRLSLAVLAQAVRPITGLNKMTTDRTACRLSVTCSPTRCQSVHSYKLILHPFKMLCTPRCNAAADRTGPAKARAFGAVRSRGRQSAFFSTRRAKPDPYDA